MAITIPGGQNTNSGDFINPSSSQNGAKNVNGTEPGFVSGNLNGSTSGITTWVPDILKLGEDACEQAHVDFTTAYSLRGLKTSLDFLAMEWANEGLNLWTLDLVQQQLTANNPGPYIMPGDTVDLQAPAIRTTYPNGYQEDLGISRIDFNEYLLFPNKLQTGRPVTVFVQRVASQPQFFVWEVPSASDPNIYSLLYWRLKRIQNTGYPSNLIDVPFRFLPALRDGCAWRMAMKKKGDMTPVDLAWIQYLERVYRMSFDKARYEDREKADTQLVGFWQD